MKKNGLPPVRFVTLGLAVVFVSFGTQAASAWSATEDALFNQPSSRVLDQPAIRTRADFEVSVTPVKILGPEPEGAPSDFRLGSGDVLKISVWGYPELSHELTVLPDGTITYPLIGSLLARGLTVSEVEAAVEDQMLLYIDAPRISVVISEMRSRRFSTMGALRNAGTYTLWDDDVTVLEAIAHSGGWTEEGLLSEVKIFRASVKDIPETIQVDLESLLEEPTGYVALKILPGDVIYVPSKSSRRKVCVLGEVGSPGLYSWSSGMTVIDALSAAGWLRNSGVAKNVIVARRSPDGRREFFHVNVNVKQIFQEQEWSQDIKLKPGDMIYVSERMISKVSDLITYLATTVDPAARSYLSVYDATNPADFTVDRN